MTCSPNKSDGTYLDLVTVCGDWCVVKETIVVHGKPTVSVRIVTTESHFAVTDLIDKLRKAGLL